MSGHLPECFYRRGTGESVTINPICICDRLRACEQRVQGEQELERLRAYEKGCKVGVQAARDAVMGAEYGDQHHIWDAAIAAIDALTEHKSRSGYDPRATDERP